MADQDDVRRIALSLPGACEEKDRFAFSVEVKGKQKGFVWVWRERLDVKKPRVPRPDVVAIRVANRDEKAALLAGDPDKFFTEPHYNGFPAVLVRLPAVTRAELSKLIVDAWRCQAPRSLVDREATERPSRTIARKATSGTPRTRAGGPRTAAARVRKRSPRR